MRLSIARGNFDRGSRYVCVTGPTGSLSLRHVVAHPIKAWRYLFRGWRELLPD